MQRKKRNLETRHLNATWRNGNNFTCLLPNRVACSVLCMQVSFSSFKIKATEMYLVCVCQYFFAFREDPMACSDFIRSSEQRVVPDSSPAWKGGRVTSFISNIQIHRYKRLQTTLGSSNFCQIIGFFEMTNADRKSIGNTPYRFADLYHSANRTPVSTPEVSWFDCMA